MNFNKDINRYNTNSLKYDFKKVKGKPDDVFPMWVADMDFKCPKEVTKEMNKRIKHGIFGYSQTDTEYFKSVYNWYKNNFNVTLKEDWLIKTPGVVFALATAVKILTKEKDCVLINNPVYYPFSEVVVDNNRKIISSDLVLENDSYHINFEDMEDKIKKHKIKLYLLCSPHNPVGRVWKKRELDKIIEICKRNKVFIVSDEIHSDFIWNDKHISLLKYKEYLDNIMVCTSPSKTFNLAGLQVSNIFIPNKKIRDNFQNEIWKTGYSLVNTMGIVACKAAYDKGYNWLKNLKEYLKDNIDFVNEFLKEHLPKVKLIYPEGTYLLWLDFKGLKLNDDELYKIMINDAKLWLDSGAMFGKTGKGFQRLNIALPRKKLRLALEQLERAFSNEAYK